MRGCNDEFGSKTEILPQIVVKVNRFELNTLEVAIKVNPERHILRKYEVIYGIEYILIRADNGLKVNGMNIIIILKGFLL